MSWNYRVMRMKVGEETMFAIHEVFYNGAGLARSWTERPVRPIYITPTDGINWSLRQELDRMAKALDFPVLDYETGKEITDADNPLEASQRES